MACAYCEDRFPIINESILSVSVEYGELWASYFSDEENDIMEHEAINFCPMCGEKLGCDA